MASDSPVDICNKALDKVGEAPITSLEAGISPTGDLCARHYDDVRQELLREFVWQFARRTMMFQYVGPAQGTRYKDAYQFPKDVLRLCYVGTDKNTERQHDYTIEDDPRYGKVLMVNYAALVVGSNSPATNLEVTVVVDMPEVSKWDSQFRKCMTLAMALAVCYTITKSNSTWERLSKELSLSLPAAVSADGQEHPPERDESSRFIQARLFALTPGIAGMYTDLRNTI